MTVTADSFRASFPAFQDSTTYPDPQVNMWISFATSLLNAAAWQDMLDMGTMLMVAHQISMEAVANAEAASGAQPGAAKGILTSGGAAGATFSYDASSVAAEGAGYFNLTIYGQRYWRLAMMFGAGPQQIGADPNSSDISSSPSSFAWPGPYWY